MGDSPADGTAVAQASGREKAGRKKACASSGTAAKVLRYGAVALRYRSVLVK